MPNPTSNDQDAELAANVEKLRQRLAAKVAKIKAALVIWLKAHDNEDDSVCVTIGGGRKRRRQGPPESGGWVRRGQPPGSGAKFNSRRNPQR
jgi:hypothetical protein